MFKALEYHFGSAQGFCLDQRNAPYRIQKSVNIQKDKKTKEIDAYPILKIDRITEQDLLRILRHKGIFNRYSDLNTKEEILQSEKTRLNKEKLSFEEERRALKNEKEYRLNYFVVRDYGDYAIGFSCNLYEDFLFELEEGLRDIQKQPFLFSNMNSDIENALRAIKLYRMGEKLARIILAEVYIQKKCKRLVIPKDRIRWFLGYDSSERQIYTEIKDSLISLMYCHYIIWKYSYTNTTKEQKRSTETIGAFIYNIEENTKSFVLDVNELFVGCVQYLFSNKRLTKRQKKELFQRGYYGFPTGILPLTKNYSPSAEFLTYFLVKEKGNSRINEPSVKVIVYKIKRFIKEAYINYSRKDHAYKKFINSLREIEIIQKTDPTIEELRQTKATVAWNKILRIYIKDPSKELDRYVKKILSNRMEDQSKKSNTLVTL